MAPLYSGLFALLGEELGHPATDIPQALYDTPDDVFRDITNGNNDTPPTQDYGPAVVGFQATQGWDACTGLGSIVGSSLAAHLANKKELGGAPTS